MKGNSLSALGQKPRSNGVRQRESVGAWSSARRVQEAVSKDPSARSAGRRQEDLFALAGSGHQSQSVSWEEFLPKCDFELRQCRQVRDCPSGEKIVQSSSRYLEAFSERPLTRLPHLLGERGGKCLRVDRCVKVLFRIAGTASEARIGPLSARDEFDGCAAEPASWSRPFRFRATDACLHLGTLPRVGGIASTTLSETPYGAQYIAHIGGGNGPFSWFVSRVRHATRWTHR